MRSAQGLRDQTRVTGPWRRWPGQLLYQGLLRCSRPGRAGDGDSLAFFPHAGSRSPGPVHPPRPASSQAGPRRGRLWGRGRGGGRRLTHAYTRPSASSTPSPPYRGTCVQQPRHIRAGPARPLRRPRLLPGRAGSRPQMHPGRSRVTWRAGLGCVRQRLAGVRLALAPSPSRSRRPGLTELGFQNLLGELHPQRWNLATPPRSCA